MDTTGRLFHGTFVLSDFLMLTKLFLVLTLNRLGAARVDGAGGFGSLGCLRFGSTCVKYLSYSAKLNPFVALFTVAFSGVSAFAGPTTNE